ncbi:MAG TPA: hypothetical protein VIH90_05285 [Candidatus Saccharimonadales bacterium]
MNKKPVDTPKRKINYRLIALVILFLAVVLWLMFFRLGNIMGGVTSAEANVMKLPLGWHGIYKYPMNLPINVLRSVEMKFLSPLSPSLLRLPNVIFGIATVICFYALCYVWYGVRTATMTTAMFATSAWTLHVSRLASYNVEYLFAMTAFLLTTAALHRHPKNKYWYVAINFLWSILLFVPGMVWLIGYDIWRQRKEIQYGFQQQNTLVAIPIYVASAIVALPLLLLNFTRSPDNFTYWLGIPNKLNPALTMIKDFFGVFVHIFIRGPENPALWMGKASILDVFALVCAAIGIYFYITHLKASRAKLLFISFAIGTVLISLGGAVDLSILIPIVFLFIAAGLAYLLQQWLQVFPRNPIARGIGYGLIILAVTLSCVYNLRAYYVAWPHNPTSQSVFDVRL